MDWNQLLRSEIEYTYNVTDKLLDLVDDDRLDWKPDTGDNWMTTGQLLMHISNACGVNIRGFVTGDWGMPDGFDPADLSPEDMLPPAEKMPAAGSVAEAKELLAKDKQTGLAILAECDNDKLANEIATAPWDPTEMALGHRLLQMVQHLSQHKTQLFYYLKLQGKPVNTGHLWGM